MGIINFKHIWLTHIYFFIFNTEKVSNLHFIKRRLLYLNNIHFFIVSNDLLKKVTVHGWKFCSRLEKVFHLVMNWIIDYIIFSKTTIIPYKSTYFSGVSLPKYIYVNKEASYIYWFDMHSLFTFIFLKQRN